MVSLDEAVIARFKKGDHEFEILVDPYKAYDFRRGKDIPLEEILVTDEIFTDARKGFRASQEDIRKVFGTTDVSVVAKTILLEGDIQLTTEQRRKMQDEKRKAIVNLITKLCVDPRTGYPYTPARIEAAFEEVGVHIDPFKDPESQAKEIIKELKKHIPIKVEYLKIRVVVPPQYSAKAYGLIKSYSPQKEDWTADGSLEAILEIPAGVFSEFSEKINHLTHGDVQIDVIERSSGE